jgi:hypothetical protein
MVKDSKQICLDRLLRFQFNDGKPADEATHKACFACHQPFKDRDFVFIL